MAQALYRKHRSKSLDEVIGQEHITETLKKALSKGQISHAYLFTGPRGVGKTSVARILAHAINDIEYIGEDTHLDIIEIDAASNRRIDEIRELRDKVHIAPTSSKYKVYIIDEVHMLTREAFNALLKTLEEPPEHAVFILATTEAHKVPDTIISRTQRYTFKPIEQSKAVDHLRAIAKQEKLDITDTALELLSRHGQGSFRDSISMLDQLSGMQKKRYDETDVRLLLGLPGEDDIMTLLTKVNEGDRQALLSHIDDMKGQGHDAALTIQAVSRTLRDHFASGTLILSEAQTLNLLRTLNERGSSSYLQLELALLSVMSPATEETAPKPAKQPIAKITPPKVEELPKESGDKPPEEAAPESQPEPEEKEKPADSQPETDQKQKPTKKRPVTNTDFDETWQTMLTDVRSKHNTLHGILRMAQPRLEDNKLVLLFSFGFHKKQLESPKNSPLLKQYVRQHLGDVELSIVVETTAKKPEEKPAEKQAKSTKNADIENVSSIFGGAELLE